MAGGILLLAKPNSYRLAAFQRAAIAVGAKVWIGLDTPPGFATQNPSVVPIPFDDPDACLATIRARIGSSGLAAVVAVDDSAADLAEFLRSEYGLQSNGRASSGRDKSEMRRLFAAAGLPGPRNVRISPDDDPVPVCRAIGYPVVIKPTSLNGSRGVIRADNDDQASAAFARTTKIVMSEGFSAGDKCLLIEQFIPGFEVALEGVMTDGRLTVLALFDKPDPLDGPYFEETIYVTPSRLSPVVQAEIASTAERMATAIGIWQGPVHAEMRINESGVWPLEIAARSIGGQCSTVLNFGSGLSLEEIILRNAIGLPIESTGGGMAVGVMMIPIPRTGILQAVHGIEAATQVAGITGIDVTAPLHQPIIALPEGASYLGFIFAKADSPADVEQTLRTAHTLLEIDIAPMLTLQPI